MRKAKADALRLLRFRPRSIKEIAQRLKQKGHRSFIIEQTINELKEKKFLDDKAFAKLWIGERMSLKPEGKHLITRELKSKGVNEEIIDSAFRECQNTFDEYEIARPLALRKFGQLKDVDEEKAKKKLFDLLSRRGFSYNTIWKIIKDCFGNTADLE